MFLNKTWTLREKLIHWDTDYKYCIIPLESNAITFMDNQTTSTTSRHVHHSKYFRSYIDKDYQQYLRKIHDKHIIELANLGAQYAKILEQQKRDEKILERKQMFAAYPQFCNLRQDELIRIFMTQKYKPIII